MFELLVGGNLHITFLKFCRFQIGFSRWLLFCYVHVDLCISTFCIFNKDGQSGSVKSRNSTA